MDKYMMMMFVTLEQETAVKHLFLCRGWKYRKQDMSKTTEEVGPPDHVPDKEEPVCPIVKSAPVGRPRKIRPNSEEPQAKRTKFSESQTPVSATSADTSLTTAKTPAKTATATATSASSSVTPSESSVSPRRSGRTPKPNRFRIKEEAIESTNDDESLQLPLILSVESLEDTLATDPATALESTTIPVTPSTSTLTTAQDFTGISSEGFDIEVEQALDTKIDPDFDPVSEGDDYGDDDDDFEEDLDESATIDSAKKAAASSSSTGKDKKPQRRKLKLKRKQYDPTAMATAIEMVRGGMSKTKAAKIYGVPRTTLLDKLEGRVPEGSPRPGPKPVLTSAEEKTLVDHACLMAEIGCPLTKKEIYVEVKRILDLDGRKTPFPNNMPGRGWFDAFKCYGPTPLLLQAAPQAGVSDPRKIKDEEEAYFIQVANDAYGYMVKGQDGKMEGNDAYEYFMKDGKPIGRRKKYQHYDRATKLMMGEFAVEHGATKTSKHFQNVLGFSVGESTVRSFRSYFLKSQKQ